jgi:3-methylcrotonyl-CoA carboxylase alpha subunit
VFAKILIANRGEIACRVMRTAQRLGIACVAVYTDADRGALHVRRTPQARRVSSYLDIESILAAAREAGAEAIHPGYGFLSENEDFAAACATAGVVFIGPSAQAIAAMGDKAAAKRLMEKAGVPLVPGYHGEEQDPAFLEKEAARIGFPVLIKPSAGGGGKGMRVVAARKEFAAALAGAKREAKSAFGDERVLVERYLERPRHIEVQVLGDGRGNLVHLFERDCSVQRRHQKVLEEAPAPGLDPGKRSEMGAAAVAAARAIGYSNAGTVEFIAGQDGRFYFMEMNTRLQVEHPVTESVTGLDLVELQIRVAAGEALPFSQEELALRGHAIEARLYAEEPERGFLPQTGRLVHVAFPEDPDVRVDAGVASGDEITPWYDPMIAKLIVHGRDRPAALARLRQALAAVEIAGVKTNLRFLRRVAASPGFTRGELDTGLIDRNPDLVAPPCPLPVEILAAAAYAELADEERTAREHAAGSGDRYSPWHQVDGWRLNADSHHDFVFVEGETEHAVRVGFRERGLSLCVGGRDHRFEGGAGAGGSLRIRLDDRVLEARAVRQGDCWHVFSGGDYRRLALKEVLPRHDEDARIGTLAAPMPGRVIEVMSRPGEAVKKGQALLILEAMKMEHTVTAPVDGIVKEIHFAPGEQVIEGAELITLE